MKNLTFKRIYTGNYSDIGHSDGVTDGKQGKPKSHFGVLTKRHWFNTMFWQANESHNSYVTGYDKGYDGGQRIRENIYHNTSTKGVTMSGLERYDRVLSGLRTSEGNIRANIRQLQEQLAHYSRQIEGMKQVGFLEDYADKLRAYNGLKMRIDKLQEFLEEILSKIKEIENHIQQLKADANNIN